MSVSSTPSIRGKITRDSDHIRVAGHVGTWYVIDEGYFAWVEDTPEGGTKATHSHLFLLEHERYGDEAAGVIVDERGSLVLEDVYNGFGDLEEAGWAEISEQEYRAAITKAE